MVDVPSLLLHLCSKCCCCCCFSAFHFASLAFSVRVPIFGGAKTERHRRTVVTPSCARQFLHHWGGWLVMPNYRLVGDRTGQGWQGCPRRLCITRRRFFFSLPTRAEDSRHEGFSYQPFSSRNCFVAHGREQRVTHFLS